MKPENLKQFWVQLKGPLKANWDKLTESDLEEIEGDLPTFMVVPQTPVSISAPYLG